MMCVAAGIGLWRFRGCSIHALGVMKVLTFLADVVAGFT